MKPAHSFLRQLSVISSVDLAEFLTPDACAAAVLAPLTAVECAAVKKIEPLSSVRPYAQKPTRSLAITMDRQRGEEPPARGCDADLRLAARRWTVQLEGSVDRRNDGKGGV